MKDYLLKGADILLSELSENVFLITHLALSKNYEEGTVIVTRSFIGNKVKCYSVESALDGLTIKVKSFYMKSGELKKVKNWGAVSRSFSRLLNQSTKQN